MLFPRSSFRCFCYFGVWSFRCLVVSSFVVLSFCRFVVRCVVVLSFYRWIAPQVDEQSANMHQECAQNLLKSIQHFRNLKIYIPNQQNSDPNQAKCGLGRFFGVVGRRVGERMPTLVGCNPLLSPFWPKMVAQGRIVGAILDAQVGPKTMQKSIPKSMPK